MADVELLPLPEPVVVAEELEFGAIYAYERRHMEAYTRANMEPLRAENERLRAEVELWRHKAAVHQYRRERLAEALRMFLAAGVGNSTNFETQFKAAQAARAALAQEDRND